MPLSRRWIYASLFLFVPVVAGICYWSQSPSGLPVAYAWPRPGSHDVGVVLVGARETRSLRHKFRITNQSQSPRHFTRITKGCSCTEASLSSSELPPAKVVELTLTADIGARRGRQVFSCTIESDDGMTASYELEAEIHSTVETDPPHLDLGTVSGSNPPVRRATLNIYAPAGTALRPLRFSTGGDDRLAVDFNPADCVQERKKAYTKYTVSVGVTLRAGRDSKREFGRSELRLIDKRTNETLFTLPVSWRVVEPIAVHPSRLLMRLDPTKGIHSASRSVVIRRSDGKLLNIAKTASTHDAFHVSVRKLDDRSSRIDIRVDDNRLGVAILNGSVSILTTLDDDSGGQESETVLPITVLTEVRKP